MNITEVWGELRSLVHSGKFYEAKVLMYRAQHLPEIGELAAYYCSFRDKNEKQILSDQINCHDVFNISASFRPLLSDLIVNTGIIVSDPDSLNSLAYKYKHYFEDNKERFDLLHTLVLPYHMQGRTWLRLPIHAKVLQDIFQTIIYTRRSLDRIGRSPDSSDELRAWFPNMKIIIKDFHRFS